jgi:hypothetical protein
LSYQNICFRPATAEELRLAALRQLIFEEPVSRLARLKKTIQRQLARSEREKVKQLSIYQLAELHGHIFATDDISSSALISSLVVNLALLLEDFRLYTPTAFSAFVASNARFLQGQDFAGDSRSQCIFDLAQKLAEILKLGPERSRWLTIGLLTTIDWAAAASAGEGANGNQQKDREHDQDDALRILPSLLQLVADQIKCLQLNSSLPFVLLIDTIDCRALILVAQKVASKIRESLRPTLVVLVEGQSELIVLPHFARLKGEPLESMGALVIASGGAKQVVRRYLTMKDVLSIPIVCVFDGDAEDSSVVIEEALRDCDGLICLEASELEDCYSYEQLLKILNLQLVQIGQTLSSESFDLPKEGPRKNALNKLFRSRGLGNFDKIAFAKSTVDLALSKEDVPLEMSRVIDFVAETCKRFSPALPQY